jgi:hypothetical protein
MKIDANVQLLLHEHHKGLPQVQITARARMSERTAHKYERAGALRRQLKKPRTQRTRPDHHRHPPVRCYRLPRLHRAASAHAGSGNLRPATVLATCGGGLVRTKAPAMPTDPLDWLLPVTTRNGHEEEHDYQTEASPEAPGVIVATGKS